MGRMKSLAYAYAQYISAETGADEMDVFGDIVDGGVDIPKWFINEWLSANPIFASEENEDYEVIMTNIGHSMERDGETIVFGDVMFATPNDGRSRISSYGQGADKASARQALIDRAIEHLQREEFNAEGNSMHDNLAKVADETSNYYRSRPNPDLSEIAAELRGRNSSDKKITLTHSDLIGVMCSSYKAGRQDILDNFDQYRNGMLKPNLGDSRKEIPLENSLKVL